jgi:hypothetical protein
MRQGKAVEAFHYLIASNLKHGNVNFSFDVENMKRACPTMGSW